MLDLILEIERDHPGLARGLRQTGYLGMLAAGLLLVGQLAYTAERSDAALELHRRPALTVRGSETIVPIASDGHFWVKAEVNGQELDFLIDTGATFTGLGKSAAQELGIQLDTSKAPLELETANGVITATMGKVDYLRGFKENVIMGHIIPAGTGRTRARKRESGLNGLELPSPMSR